MIVERRFKVLLLVLATAVQGGTLAAQQARPAHILTVTKEGTTFLTLKAADAKLSDIAADVARQLNVKVLVAPSLKDEKITAEFAGTPLEPAMLALAPRVFIDYEVRRDAEPRPLGVHLLGLGDPDPAPNAVVQGTSQGLYVSGNTEDTGQPAKDAPLRITYAKGRLAVFAKEQPLIGVVMAIAEELGVPAEIKYESRQVISVDIRETTAIEDVFVGLSENVRVYVRSSANRLDRTLLRVVVVPPEAK